MDSGDETESSAGRARLDVARESSVVESLKRLHHARVELRPGSRVISSSAWSIVQADLSGRSWVSAS